MSNEQRNSFFDKSADASIVDSERIYNEKTAERKAKVESLIQEIESVYQSSATLESVHRNAIRGFLAAIGTLLREENLLLETTSQSEIASRGIDVTTRELLKQSLSELGMKLEGSSEF